MPSTTAYRLPVALALGLAALAALWGTGAQSQVQALPSYVPVGVSASGSGSTVWFHEPSSRRAVACQTVSSGTTLASIQCVATNLP